MAVKFVHTGVAENWEPEWTPVASSFEMTAKDVTWQIFSYFVPCAQCSTVRQCGGGCPNGSQPRKLWTYAPTDAAERMGEGFACSYRSLDAVKTELNS